MTLYVINTPILTDYGIWSFTGPLSVSEAQNLLSAPFVSAIGHEASAAVLSQLLHREIPVNRIQIQMQRGDRALILRLLKRLPEGKILDETELKALDFEFGLLERLK